MLLNPPSVGPPAAKTEAVSDQPPVDKKPPGRSRRVYARLDTKVNISYKIVNVKGKAFKQKDLKSQYSMTAGISAYK